MNKDISIDKLLEIVNNKEESYQAPIVTKNDVLSFIIQHQIEPGKYPVSGTLIYEFYKAWSLQPVTKISFFIEFHKYVPEKEGYKGFFLVNLTSLKIKQTALNSLKKIDPVKNPNNKVHFENYLNYYGFKPGNYKIEDFILYHYYDKYTYEKNTKTYLNERAFGDFCKLYFKTTKTLKGVMVHITDNINISEESMNNIREARKLYGKRKKQKTKRTISSSKA